MKRFYWLMLLFALLLVLSSCKIEKTYSDLRFEFESHLEETKSNYIEKINSFNNLTENNFSCIVKIDLNNKHGTGVIFQYDEDSYYILTNAHLIYDNLDDKNAKVYDAFDNHYDFIIIDYSLDYDLAIIKIGYERDLSVAIFSKFNNSKNSESIIIGFHGTQKNAVTYGVIIVYDAVDLNNDNRIKIKFPIMISSNPVKHGSSGSAVFNKEGLLLGLLFAGSFDNSDTAKYAFSIPVERIIEYLGNNDLSPIYKEDLS